MSAAANAAGYLYTQRLLPLGAGEQRTEAASHAPASIPAAAVKPARTPKIAYRKRRVYELPSAA